MPPAPTLSARPTYRRHRPEQTVLYSVIAEHYPRFVQEIDRSGGHLPRFVRQEFEDYLKCGLLEHGFLRVKCDGFALPLRAFGPCMASALACAEDPQLIARIFAHVKSREAATAKAVGQARTNARHGRRP